MSLSQYLLESKDYNRLQARLHNIWLIRVRWFYLILLGVTAYVSSSLSVNSDDLRRFVVSLLAVALMTNGLLWLVLRSKNHSLAYYKIVAFTQILLDVALASSVVYFQGGLNSRATLLYAFPIVGKGILFEQTFAYTAALLSSVSYVGTILIYQLQHPYAYSLKITGTPLIFYCLVFFVLAFMISRFTANTLSDERRQSFNELLAMLRHQLHQPTSVMAAIIEMLEHSDNYSKWSPRDRQYLKQLKQENLRLNNMMTNVLEATNQPSDQPILKADKIDLLQLLNQAATESATAARRMSDLSTKLPIEHVEFLGQKQPLRTAFDNILDNAFRYSKKGTPVTISMGVNKQKATITIIISDQGIGMNAVSKKKLFQLFTHLEEDPQVIENPTQLYSMGIGLFVAKTIIERHRGKMEIESEPGHGTDIIIKFQE